MLKHNVHAYIGYIIYITFAVYARFKSVISLKNTTNKKYDFDGALTGHGSGHGPLDTLNPALFPAVNCIRDFDSILNFLAQS